MSRAPDDRLTAESLYSLPDDDLQHELVRGYLVSEPPPMAKHGRIAARITHLLLSYLDDNPIGEVLTCDSGFVLARSPDTVRAPDVALVVHGRYPSPDEENAFISGAPDLAVEVLSPGDRPARVAAKVEDYLAADAAYVWIVDPRQETVQVHRQGCASVTLESTQEVAVPDLLPGFCVTVDKFFGFTRIL